jgi:hypothetical protein
MTQPIIARLYMDRQRQAERLGPVTREIESARNSLMLEMRPEGKHYASREDYDAAMAQFYDWSDRLWDLICDMTTVHIAINDSLSAPDSHLKGYPQ